MTGPGLRHPAAQRAVLLGGDAAPDRPPEHQAANDGPGSGGLRPLQLSQPGLMTATVPSGTYYPDGRQQPRGPRPWCMSSSTDEHLRAESITALDKSSDSLAVAFSCSSCNGSRVQATTAELLAPVLARNPGLADDVVHVGSLYIHCGEPMTPPDPARRTWSVRFTPSPDRLISWARTCTPGCCIAGAAFRWSRPTSQACPGSGTLPDSPAWDSPADRCLEDHGRCGCCRHCVLPLSGHLPGAGRV